MLTSSTQLPNRSFHVVERTRTSSKCPNLKNSRAKQAKPLFFIVKYANLRRPCCRQSLWLLKLWTNTSRVTIMCIETSKYEKHQKNWFQNIGKWLIFYPTFEMTLIGSTRSNFLLNQDFVLVLINSYSSRTRRIWADIYIYNQRGRRPSWLLSAHIRQVQEE